jgi:hypothetical protein
VVLRIGSASIFALVVWHSSIAYGGVKTHILAGGNATQVKLVGSDETSTSNGYASYAAGGGLSASSDGTLALTAEAFYANRKFGFGDTSAGFSTLQFPIMARYQGSSLYIGGGLYAALWTFKGEMITSGQTKMVKVSETGQSSTDLGFVLSSGLKQKIFGLPLLFELRRFQSVNDVAKSTSFKGSLVEWQALVGLQFNDDMVAVKTPPKTTPRTEAKPAGTIVPPAAPPPLILNKSKPTGEEGVVILPPEDGPPKKESPDGGNP